MGLRSNAFCKALSASSVLLWLNSSRAFWPQASGLPSLFPHDLIHETQSRFVLAGRFLFPGAIDADENRLTAPLEFFAAAAGTRLVGILCHEDLLVVKTGGIACSAQDSRSLANRESWFVKKHFYTTHDPRFKRFDSLRICIPSFD